MYALKYKEKYLNLKNQLGSGRNEMMILRFRMMQHIDIKRLGKTKIVATPQSGSEPRIMLNMWLALDDADKEKLKIIYQKEHGWTLGVYIYRDESGEIPEQPIASNLIIFYVVEYLDLLAIASGKTTEELLKILAVVQFKDRNLFNYDLIKIAFGDIFGNGYNDEPLETEEGVNTLAKYIALSQI